MLSAVNSNQENAACGAFLDSEFSSDAPENTRYEAYSAAKFSSLETRGSTEQKRKASTQQRFEFDRVILKSQLADRILKIDPENEEGKILAGCHTDAHRATCNDCKKSKIFWNRCERRYCPLCARRLARERKEQISFWFSHLKNPKFLTLTVRNVEFLTSEYLKNLKKDFKRLRRSTLFKRVSGGFWSLEITNQGNGFHCHFHVLFDGPFLPQAMIEKKWSKVIGQEKSIVDIRDARRIDYLNEIVKYTAKPTQMINWPNSQLLNFLEISKNVKFFGVFGSLYGARGEWSDLVALQRLERQKCECGACNWEITFEWTSVDPITTPCHSPPQKFLFPPFEKSVSNFNAIAN